MLTPVAGSIFGPLSRSFLRQRVFTNEISISASGHIPPPLFCVCGMDSFYPPPPRIRTFDQKKIFMFSFLRRKLSGALNLEIYLRSTSSAQQKFLDEVTRNTWKTKQNLEIWPFRKIPWWKKASGKLWKIYPNTGVSDHNDICSKQQWRKCQIIHPVSDQTIRHRFRAVSAYLLLSSWHSNNPETTIHLFLLESKPHLSPASCPWWLLTSSTHHISPEVMCAQSLAFCLCN